MQAVAASPAIPALLTQQAVQTAAAQQPANAAAPGPMAVTSAGTVSDPVPHFFSALQFAALRRLSALLLPAIGGNPGALDAGAPEFLDFLIGESLPDRQQAYKAGLDLLNSQATKRFAKAFAALDDQQADAIVRPLLTPINWAYDLPKDPGKYFLAIVHDDIRTATRNSREWGAAAAAAGRRTSGAQTYWNPVDPIYKG